MLMPAAAAAAAAAVACSCCCLLPLLLLRPPISPPTQGLERFAALTQLQQLTLFNLELSQMVSHVFGGRGLREGGLDGIGWAGGDEGAS
jgi:hypothetical protein